MDEEDSATFIESDRIGSDRAGNDARKPWVTPSFTISDVAATRADVSLGTDGGTPYYGQYGS